MTGFNHGMTGAVIALAVREPLFALPLSLLSHYATDFIPHFGFKKGHVFGKTFNRYLIADFLVAVIFMASLGAIFPEQKWLIWICMIVAALPDIVWLFYRRSVKIWPRSFDGFTSWHYRANLKSHVDHIYYDVLWLLAAWVVVGLFRI